MQISCPELGILNVVLIAIATPSPSHNPDHLNLDNLSHPSLFLFNFFILVSLDESLILNFLWNNTYLVPQYLVPQYLVPQSWKYLK